MKAVSPGTFYGSPTNPHLSTLVLLDELAEYLNLIHSTLLDEFEQRAFRARVYPTASSTASSVTHPAIIHTDHKPLVHFLKSDLHEGIYGHRADQLRRLNIEIKYIPGPRNKVADGLSRTLFDEVCSETHAVIDMYEALRKKGPHWVWKDGKGGYEEMLSRLSPHSRSEMIDHSTVDGVVLHALEVMTTNADVTNSWALAYQTS